jgi:alcohol dehydrogenase YqhD (iron-dependent ADH family)
MDVDIWEYFLLRVPKPETIPLFTVLTLSATASEIDAGGVITNPETRLKVGRFFDFPVASAVDPTVQFSLPWRQVMCGAVDSLSHLMENYFSPPNKSITTREVNFGLQRSIIKSMERLVVDPKDYDARANFVWAVSLALQGVGFFTLRGDGNVHNIEHAVSAYDDKIAHGEGLAVVSLAYYPQLYAKGEITEQFEAWAEGVFGTKDVHEALRMYRELYVLWKAPLKLGDIGIGPEAVDEIVRIEQSEHAVGMVSPLWPLSAADTKQVLTAAK